MTPKNSCFVSRVQPPRTRSPEYYSRPQIGFEGGEDQAKMIYGFLILHVRGVGFYLGFTRIRLSDCSFFQAIL